jgi:glycosyltransferase involved in cell wall biosynthesis
MLLYPALVLVLFSGSKQLNPLKILHLLSQRPDSTGSGIYIQAMLREAANRGHANFLLAGIASGQKPSLEGISNDACEFVDFAGRDLPFEIVGMSDVMPYPSKRFCDLSEGEMDSYEDCFAGKLKAVMEYFKPDIIHSHHLWIVTSVARRKYPELPMVTSCHGTELRQLHHCPHLAKPIVDGCHKLDGVLALSQIQKEEVTNSYGIPCSHIHVVGAGYNTAIFFPVPKPLPRPVQIVYAGKLNRSKGVPWLLRALAQIDELPWQLHLVGSGSGPEKEECLRMAEKLGKRAIIYGALSQPELAGIMQGAHLFVLPSFFEGLPLVLLEALACGCRLIATSLPGVAEVLGGLKTEYIRLVKPPRFHSVDQPFEDDEALFEENLSQAIREQITAIIMEPEIDHAQIEDQIAAFSWEKVFAKIEQVYYRVLDH